MKSTNSKKSTNRLIPAAYLLAAGAMTVGLAVAQRPGFRPRAATDTTTTGTTTTRVTPIDALKTYLTLTDAQVSAIQVIRTAAETSTQTYFTQLRTKEQALNAALRANPVDSTAVTALRADITSIQASITKVHTDASAQEVTTLTPAQQAKVATLAAAVALRDQIEGAAMLGLITPPDGGRGFGGPGGRGPGGPGGRGKGKGGPPPR